MKSKTLKSPGSLVLRGGRYYCFWRVNGKAICKVLKDENGASITTEPEAQRAKAKLMQVVALEDKADMLTSIAHKVDDTQARIKAIKDAKNPPLALKQAWATFKASPDRRDCSPASLRMYEIKWEKFVGWVESNHPGVTTLRDVTKDIADEYLTSLNHGTLASGTFNFNLFVLRLVFRILHDQAKLTEDVWKKAKLKTSISHSRRELTIDELKKVCNAATGELRLLFAIGLYTGLRMGDAVTLKWSETDLRRGMIRLVPNKIARRKPNAFVKIPIHPDLALMLSEIPANKRGEYVLPEMAAQYNSPSRSLVSTVIQDHFKTCGIKIHGERENGCRPVVEVGYHSFRHSFVSLSREAGAPLSVVESIVGHHSASMTMHYSHTSEEAAKSAVALLPSLNGEASSPSLRELVESMTPENLTEKKAAVLALLARSGSN